MEQTQIEPGDRAPAPGPLRVIQLFVNTNDLETGPDLLPDAAALQAWLLEHELLGAGDPVSDDDHARAIALREAIRELVSAHAGLPHDPAAGEVVNEAGRRAGLRAGARRPGDALRADRRAASTARSATSWPPSTPRSPRAPGSG